MQIIYNITLTLWLIVAVLRLVDGAVFDDNALPWFYRVSGAVVLAALCFSVASALAWIWG